MEKNIYDRQINKQGISDRVVDEMNPQNLLAKKQIDVLMRSDVSLCVVLVAVAFVVAVVVAVAVVVSFWKFFCDV